MVAIALPHADLLQSRDELELVMKDEVLADDSRTLLAVCPSQPSLLLLALAPSLHSLRLHDLTTKATLFSLPPAVQDGGAQQRLHALAFLDPQTHPHTLVSCSGRVQGVGLEMWDYRQAPTQPVAATPTQSTGGGTPTHCSMDVSGRGSPSSPSGGVRLAVMTEAGSLAMYDSRNLHGGPTATCLLSKKGGGGAKGGFPLSYSTRFGSSRPNPPSPCVRVCRYYK